MTPTNDAPQKLPGTFKQFAAKFPKLADAHQQTTEHIEQLGSLDKRTCELIKIGISLGAGLESAVRSHVRRAAEHGATEQEIEQAILLGMTTCGFPRTVAAWSWAQVQFERDRKEDREQDRKEQSTCEPR